MGVDRQAGPGAVAGQADVAVTVAGLARLEVAPRFPCMVGRPGMGGEHSPGMAGLALGRGEAGVIRADVRKLDVAELPPVGQELQRGTLEPGMALAAVLLVVAAGTGLRVVQRLQWMDLQPVAPIRPGSGLRPGPTPQPGGWRAVKFR